MKGYKVPSLTDKPGYSWETRNRGNFKWQKLEKKPQYWYLQMEYRCLDEQGLEIWRSPKVNGYDEKP